MEGSTHAAEHSAYYFLQISVTICCMHTEDDMVPAVHNDTSPPSLAEPLLRENTG